MPMRKDHEEQLLGIAARFRTPPGGGRKTNPRWTERRLIGLSPATVRRLRRIAARLDITPMQAAGVLLEWALAREETDDGIMAELICSRF